MISRRCVPCGGSGKVMGGGMVMKECFDCNGVGKIQEVNNELDYLQMKNTDAYKDAVKKIESSANVSAEVAAQMFEDEFKKIADEPVKTKRKYVRKGVAA